MDEKELAAQKELEKNYPLYKKMVDELHSYGESYQDILAYAKDFGLIATP